MNSNGQSPWSRIFLGTPKATPRPIHHWNFNETNGVTLLDLGSRSKNGTITGATRTIRSKNGGALDFDGNRDYIQIGANQLSNRSDWTVSLWIKRTGNAKKGTESQIRAGTGNPTKTSVLFASSTTTPTNPVTQIYLENPDHKVSLARYGKTWGPYIDDLRYVTPLNKWVHLTFVNYNQLAEGVFKLYVDGVEHFIHPESVTIALNRIGAQHNGLHGITATLDDIIIHNTSLNPRQIKDIIEDTTGPTVTITQTAGSTKVSETGGSDTYTVVLSSAPTGDVEVTVAAPVGVLVDGPDAAVVATRSEVLTFTSLTWNQPQTVTVTGVDDDVDNPVRDLIVAHTVSSTDEAFNTVIPGSVAVTVVDDDPTLVTLARSGSGAITEAAGTADVTVTLGRALVAGETVVVPLSIVGVTTDDFTLALKSGTSVNTGVSLADEGTLAPLVTFSGTGAQTAMLEFAAVQDDIDEGASETATITLGDLADSGLATNVAGDAAASDDGKLTTADNTEKIEITDDDAAGLVVAESGGSTAVAENGGTDSFTVALGSRPTHPVTVAITAAPSSAVTVRPDSLTFQRTSWNIAQTVTVTGVDDEIDNPGNERTAKVTLNLMSTDPQYEALTDQTVAVAVIDDDGGVLPEPQFSWGFDGPFLVGSGGSERIVDSASPGPVWVPAGREGGALSFDGDKDWIQLGLDHLPASDGWSASVWVRRSSGPASDSVLFAPSGKEDDAIYLSTSSKTLVGYRTANVRLHGTRGGVDPFGVCGERVVRKAVFERHLPG